MSTRLQDLEDRKAGWAAAALGGGEARVGKLDYLPAVHVPERQCHLLYGPDLSHAALVEPVLFPAQKLGGNHGSGRERRTEEERSPVHVVSVFIIEVPRSPRSRVIISAGGRVS